VSSTSRLLVVHLIFSTPPDDDRGAMGDARG
jgi:hypothetical protein